MKYGETFYGRYIALNISCSEVKSKRLSLETKNTKRSILLHVEVSVNNEMSGQQY